MNNITSNPYPKNSLMASFFNDCLNADIKLLKEHHAETLRVFGGLHMLSTNHCAELAAQEKFIQTIEPDYKLA